MSKMIVRYYFRKKNGDEVLDTYSHFDFNKVDEKNANYKQ
jgi:hypothetical protein